MAQHIWPRFFTCQSIHKQWPGGNWCTNFCFKFGLEFTLRPEDSTGILRSASRASKNSNQKEGPDDNGGTIIEDWVSDITAGSWRNSDKKILLNATFAL